jgi:hypothetical protein
VARTASLTLTRRGLLRAKVEDIGREWRSRSGSGAISASKYCEGRTTEGLHGLLGIRQK